MRNRGGVVAVAAILTFAACNTQTADQTKASGEAAALTDGDRASIVQARSATVAALGRGDVDHLYDTFTQDHVSAPPNGPSLHIGEALRTWHKGIFDQNTVQFTFTAPDLVGAGDVAVDRYDYTMIITPKAGGTPISDRGKGLWIWRRQNDGSWKLAYAIWNSDLPAQPAK